MRVVASRAQRRDCERGGQAEGVGRDIYLNMKIMIIMMIIIMSIMILCMYDNLMIIKMILIIICERGGQAEGVGRDIYLFMATLIIMVDDHDDHHRPGVQFV